MKVFVLLFLFFLDIQGQPEELKINNDLNVEWEIYKTEYGRQYEPFAEFRKRIIWEQNLNYIRQHNLEYDLGRHGHYLGLNEYSDLTNEEFKTMFSGKKLTRSSSKRSEFMAPENMGELPSSVDWRTKGYVTPVKNQGNCGSCYSFSTTGSLEGQHFRKTGSLVSFSEQQIVDCSSGFQNTGCRGGSMDNSFNYVQRFGIQSQNDYQYTAIEGRCKYNKSKVVGTCSGFVDIKVGNETDLAIAVATIGPVSVGIDATQKRFQFYKGGIYNDRKCSTDQLDHAVLVVGYGYENENSYWIVKNSWGSNWGISGYIKMSKDKANHCGIATQASYPLV